ncbi:hypothetical protein CXB51_017190 [Gossypium anomalum]|uniref:GAG-pre-integrase domain-containing protein n=1 Tax=Gossypium anomalum TaxID=47600 RepID=A0A8J5YGT5_9ROSI|nr:hypothetical protein CXB51_017190 [Gossypium anomalum]
MDSGSTDSMIAIVKFFNPVASASQKVVILVNDSNFLAWKKHVLLVIKIHRLHSYIDGLFTIPPRMLTSDDGVSVENLAFIHYVQQDFAFSMWLLSTVSASLHNRLIRSSSFTFELWQMLTRIFGTQSATKAMCYRSLLYNFKKNDLFVSAYLAGIKHFYDSLASCNQYVSLAEQQLEIVNGLSSEFDHIVSIITTSQVPFDLQGITTTLLDAEARQQSWSWSCTIWGDVATIMPDLWQDGSRCSLNEVFCPPLSYESFFSELYPPGSHFVPSTVYQPTFHPFVVSNEGTPTALQASVASTTTTSSVVTDPLWYPIVLLSTSSNEFAFTAFNNSAPSPFVSRPVAADLVVLESIVKITRWHQRLGHPSTNVLNHLLSACNISTLHTIVSSLCNACALGKSHKLPFKYATSVYSIVETGLVLLAQASLPLSYWVDAFISTVYLMNLLPTKSLHGLSPMEKLFNKQPDYKSLKVGYKYVDKIGRVYISRHVQFDEGVFPYARLSSIPPVTNFDTSRSLATLPVIIMLSHVAPPPSLDNTTIGFTMSPSVAVYIESSQPPPSTNSNVFADNDLSLNPSIPDAQNTSSSDLVPHLSPSNTHHMFTKSKAGIFKPKTKKNPNESVACNKVRLIPQGFSQIVGMDYHETFSPVVKANTKYAQELLDKAGMRNSKLISTPMVSSPTLSSLVGSPLHDGTKYRKIVGAVNLIRFSDVDWASSLEDHKSTSEFCIYLGNNLIGWSSKKQGVVSRSTSEAEYRSLANATAEITCVSSSESVLYARVKHVEHDIYFVRDKVLDGRLQVNYVFGHDQVTDKFF